MGKAWLLAIIAAAAAGLLAVDRCGSTEAWEKRLEETRAELQGAKSADSARYVAESRQDSLALAALAARADTLARQHGADLEARQAALRLAAGARRLSDSARAALAEALTLADTARQQAVIITRQDAEILRLEVVIQADSNALRSSAGEKAVLREQLGVSMAGRERERLRADTAEARLGRLLEASGDKPKGFSLLGLRLELRPYLGVGAQYGFIHQQFDLGAQAGISILRGK
jgi:hypothetical protein